MNDELIKEIKKIARKELLAEDARYLGEWNGYEVWGAKYEQMAYISYCPYVILVKDGKARLSTHEESLAYEAWRIQQRKKNANGENR